MDSGMAEFSLVLEAMVCSHWLAWVSLVLIKSRDPWCVQAGPLPGASQAAGMAASDQLKKIHTSVMTKESLRAAVFSILLRTSTPA